MRLIGNKTKLLPAIQDFLARRGVIGGTLLDVFAGTASVGRHFRGCGFKVRTNDLMWSSYVIQRAYVELDGVPDLAGVADTVRRFRADAPARDRDLRAVAEECVRTWLEEEAPPYSAVCLVVEVSREGQRVIRADYEGA